MAYKRRRSYRKSRPRKRRRTTYRRKRYARYSKYYNMRQRNPKTRSSFAPPRNVVFPNAPVQPPQDYGAWNPYLTAALSAGALGALYGAPKALRWGVDQYVNRFNRQQDERHEQQLQSQVGGTDYGSRQLPSNVAGRSNRRKQQSQVHDLVQQGWTTTKHPPAPTYADYLATLDPVQHPDRTEL